MNIANMKVTITRPMILETVIEVTDNAAKDQKGLIILETVIEQTDNVAKEA